MNDADLTIWGSGSWGTALAAHLAQNGRTVCLWARDEAQIERMRATGRNEAYLPGTVLPESVQLTASVAKAATTSSMWALAVPSHAIEDMAATLRPHLTHVECAVSLAKGIDAATGRTMTQVMEHVWTPNDPPCVALSGPSHAEEVALSAPTTVVAAHPTKRWAEAARDVFMTDRFRVYTNTDRLGVELAGAAKNVLALAAGICDGVGYGDNAKAALITRGLAELRRLGYALGAAPETFAGLAGIGDLVVTCVSGHSRNRHLGEQLGRGQTLEEALDAMHMVAEGVYTTKAIHRLAREMPITASVHAILYEDADPHRLMERLMARAPKPEVRSSPSASS
jgi:glycerol-3-phosphate dehydrogenase (NAD(P)+)